MDIRYAHIGAPPDHGDTLIDIVRNLDSQPQQDNRRQRN